MKSKQKQNKKEGVILLPSKFVSENLEIFKLLFLRLNQIKKEIAEFEFLLSQLEEKLSISKGEKNGI